MNLKVMPSTNPKLEGSIVVFAKCPISGSSKTRLSGLLGYDGAALFAKAMLSDVLVSISEDDKLCECNKVIVYAPGTPSGESLIKELFEEIGLSYFDPQTGAACIPSSPSNKEMIQKEITKNSDSVTPWRLLAMASNSSPRVIETSTAPSTKENESKVTAIGSLGGERNEKKKKTIQNSPENQPNDLKSSDLGSKLADALHRVRRLGPVNNPVVFLGMDSPELPLGEIADAINTAGVAGISKCDMESRITKAYINPAHDGGYGMLCLPTHAPLSVFEGVRWSTSITAVSQMKALSDNGIDTLVGSLMNDIDEPEDVLNLAVRLCALHSREGTITSDDNSLLDDRNVDRLLYRSYALVTSEEEGVERSSYALCTYTMNALHELGLIERSEEDSSYTTVISKWGDAIV